MAFQRLSHQPHSDAGWHILKTCPRLWGIMKQTQSWSTCNSLASNLTLIHGSYEPHTLTSFKWVQSFPLATDKPCLPAIRVQTWEALRGPPGMANTPGKRHQQQQKIAMGRPASGKKQETIRIFRFTWRHFRYLKGHTKPLFRNCDNRSYRLRSLG